MTTTYKRTIDRRWRCVVRTAANQPCHRGTGCLNEDSAREYARLLQRDVRRRAENGDLLPPALTNPARKQSRLKP